MALITPSANVSVDVSTAQFAPQITGLLAGEDLLAGAPCYIAAADGLVYMADGTAADALANLVGFTPRATAAGQPCTLYGIGTRYHYSDGNLTPGQVLYLGATAGRLDDAATVGDAVGVAFAINTTDIIIARSSPIA